MGVSGHRRRFRFQQPNGPKFANTFFKENSPEEHADFISRYNILKLGLRTESSISSREGAC